LVQQSLTIRNFIDSSILFDAEIIRKLLAQVNKEIYADNLPQSIAIDSKPIKANTKENNPKAFRKKSIQ